MSDKFRRLTHDVMKDEFLSGDKIDVTTRGDQEDLELDRYVGNATDSLLELPTPKHKI
ncbi:MAG: hypothetical protein WCC10_00505 [Tumebacillaceae bacterium]